MTDKRKPRRVSFIIDGETIEKSSNTVLLVSSDEELDYTNIPKEVLEKQQEMLNKRRESIIFYAKDSTENISENLNKENLETEDEKEFNDEFLKKIEKEQKKNQLNISEILSKFEIKFNDSFDVRRKRRSTHSKNFEQIPKIQEKFYEKVLSEKLDFSMKFTDFLVKELKETEEEVNRLLIDTNQDVNNSLKGIFENKNAAEMLSLLRMECRVRSKGDWYSLRQKWDIEHQNNLNSNLEELNSEFNLLKIEKESYEKKIEDLKEKLQLRSEKIKKYEDLCEKDDESESEKTSEKEKTKTKKLEKCIENQQNVLEDILRENERFKKGLDLQKEKQKSQSFEIENLSKEITNLEKENSKKRITETDVRKVKSNFEILSNLFKTKIQKVSGDYTEISFNYFAIKIFRNRDIEVKILNEANLKNFEVLIAKKTLEIVYQKKEFKEKMSVLVKSYSLLNELNFLRKAYKIQIEDEKILIKKENSAEIIGNVEIVEDLKIVFNEKEVDNFGGIYQKIALFN